MMLGNSNRRLAWILAAAAIVPAPAISQTLGPAPESPNRYPAALPPRKTPPLPPVSFKIVNSVALEGLLPGDGPGLDGGRIIVETAGGRRQLTQDLLAPIDGEPTADGTTPGAPDSETSPWVISDDGRYRVRTSRPGRVEAEKRGSIRRERWHRAWSLRVPNGTLAPPVISGERVFFGALDDRVHCVRLRNGHLVWVSDVDDRVSHPLAVWRGPVPVSEASGGKGAPTQAVLLLVVPDSGKNLLALDPYDGRRVARFEPEKQETSLLAPALVLADGRIALAQQRFETAEAALVVLAVEFRERETKADKQDHSSL
jgi:hypothetical protein